MAIVEPVEGPPGRRRRLALSSPADRRPLGEIEVMNAHDVAAAVERARKAQHGWAELRVEGRARFLRRAVRVLVEAQDEFAATIVEETGKAALEAVAAEIATACDVLEYYAKRARRILAERTLPMHLLRTKSLRLAWQPLGVVGVITPWNFPFILSLNPTVQALIAGNAVLLKPSEVTPRSGALVEELFRRAGLPEGVLQVLPGDAETGRALVDAEVDKICFTGSVAVGREIGERCGRRLMPCTLELGGKDPMIVCADADLDRAAAGAVWGAFANAGQVCISTERVFVVGEVYDAFLDRVLARVAGLRQGAEGEFDVGAVTHAPQLEIIERQVREAVERGARVLAGGRRNPHEKGLFWEPTVLADVTPEMAILREETFGPVLPILRVRDEDEAVALANDCAFALNANVWTRDRRKGVRLARAVAAGGVVVNDCMVSYAVTEAPFGGVKDSGVGRVNGEMGLRSFCHAKSIVVDRFGSKSESAWYPYTATKLKRTQRLIRWVWGSFVGRLLS